MNAGHLSELPVALLFRLTVERAGDGVDGTSRTLPQYRLGWVICAGGSPLLTLDYRLPAELVRKEHADERLPVTPEEEEGTAPRAAAVRCERGCRGPA